jgi:hypothetical protein
VSIVLVRDHEGMFKASAFEETPPLQSVVYFIRQGDDGPIKIGVARDAEKRRAMLQTGNPVELHLLRTVPGTARLESLLHQRLAPFRLRGEWFEPIEPLLALIARRDLEAYLEAEFRVGPPRKLEEEPPVAPTSAVCLVCGERSEGDVCPDCDEVRWVRDESTDPFDGVAA